MTGFMSDIVPILGPAAAFLAPLLVWMAANARLRHDARKSHADEDATLWQRMANMVDRYGQRADELETQITNLRQRLVETEDKANALTRKVTDLEVRLARWRAYSLALIQQILGAGLTPVNPRDYGIHDHESDRPPR